MTKRGDPPKVRLNAARGKRGFQIRTRFFVQKTETAFELHYVGGRRLYGPSTDAVFCGIRVSIGAGARPYSTKPANARNTLRAPIETS